MPSASGPSSKVAEARSKPFHSPATRGSVPPGGGSKRNTVGHSRSLPPVVSSPVEAGAPVVSPVVLVVVGSQVVGATSVVPGKLLGPPPGPPVLGESVSPGSTPDGQAESSTTEAT